LDCHDVRASIQKTGRERVTQRVPRQALDPGIPAGKSEPRLEINERFASLGIIEKCAIRFKTITVTLATQEVRPASRGAKGWSSGMHSVHTEHYRHRSVEETEMGESTVGFDPSLLNPFCPILRGKALPMFGRAQMAAPIPGPFLSNMFLVNRRFIMTATQNMIRMPHFTTDRRRKTMFKNALIFCAVSLMLVGCGGYSSSSSNSGGGGVNYTGQAQGVYSGTASSGFSFTTIVLPNDKFYTIYGTVSGNVLTLNGMVTGQGASGISTYSANVTDFLFTGLANTGTINATYVPGSSVNGILTEGVTMTTFNGASLPASTFNYNTPALLSAVSGTWTGSLLNGAPTTVSISTSGSVTGTSQGCSFSGTVATDSSNKNFYDVSLTFGASPCTFPNQTATGIGVEYLLSDGVTHQLLAAVTAGTSMGTVFAAER
jgi:hypothetical protein